MARFAKCASAADMKAQFGNAGIVCSYRVVFNIKGMTTARRRLARLAGVNYLGRPATTILAGGGGGIY